jgi:hypothetical protein
MEDIAEVWKGVVSDNTPPNERKLFAGVNVRINVVNLFAAAWATTKAVLETASIAVNPLGIMKLGDAWFGAAMAALAAIREQMHSLEYVSCLLISHAPSGLTAEDLELQIRGVLSGGVTAAPFWLGLTESRLREARDAVAASDRWMDDLLVELRKNKWIDEAVGKITFRPREFVLKGS